MINRLKLYVDMDGVLANFEQGYDDIVGGRAQWPSKADDDAFWNPIIDTPNFWRNLKPMPDYRELWAYVSQHDYVAVLSSPGTHDRSRAIVEKREWLHHHLGYSTNVVFKHSKDKQHFACPNSILIDDYGANVRRWIEAGGIGIKHTSASSTIDQLMALGVIYGRQKVG